MGGLKQRAIREADQSAGIVEPLAAAWQPPIHKESGLPLAMLVSGGKIVPLMVMPRNAHTSRYCKDRPCRNNAHWETTWSNYLQVAHRLVWFRAEHADWSILTALEAEGPDWAWMRATILTPEGRVIATATKHETQAGFADYREKAETGAVGRALALCGYGTQFSPELDEGERLADSPTTQAVSHARQAQDEAAEGPILAAEEEDDMGCLESAPRSSERTVPGPGPTSTATRAGSSAASAVRPAPQAAPPPDGKKTYRSAGPDPDADMTLVQKVRAHAERTGHLEDGGLHVFGGLVDELRIQPGIYNIAALSESTQARVVKILSKVPTRKAGPARVQ